MEPDERDQELLKEYGKELKPYGSWGSTRTRVITGIVALLIFAGIIAWAIIFGHPVAGGR